MVFSNFRGVGPNALGWRMKNPTFNVSNLSYPLTKNIPIILPVFSGGISSTISLKLPT